MDEEMYLTDLIGVDILRKIQDSFSEMSGMAAVITDDCGISVTNGSNFYKKISSKRYFRSFRGDFFYFVFPIFHLKLHNFFALVPSRTLLLKKVSISL